MKKDILYLAEADMSIDGGPNIKERGLIRNLIKEGICALILQPKYKLRCDIKNFNFINRIRGKFEKKQLVRHTNFLYKKTRKIQAITKREKIETYVFRGRAFPIDILYSALFTSKKTI